MKCPGRLVKHHAPCDASVGAVVLPGTAGKTIYIRIAIGPSYLSTQRVLVREDLLRAQFDWCLVGDGSQLGKTRIHIPTLVLKSRT